MKATILIVMTTVLFVTSNINAQSATSTDEVENASIFSGILSVNNWIKKLNQEYKNLIAEEKMDECILRLGYLGSDLEYLSVAKRKVIIAVEKGETVNLSTKVSDISAATNDLEKNIRRLKLLVNDNLGTLGSIEFSKIDKEIFSEKAKMHILMAKDTQSADFKKLKTHTNEAIKILDEAKQLVWELRAKLVNR